MRRAVFSLTLLACAAHAQVKMVGFAQGHVLLYQASSTQGAIVKLDDGRAPTLVSLGSSEWKAAVKGVTAQPGLAAGGRVPLALSVVVSNGKGAWKDDVYTWSVTPKKRSGGDEAAGHALVYVEDTMGNGSALALDVPLRAPTGKLKTYWEENGSFFAVLTEPAAGPAEVLVGRGELSATTVEVLATTQLMDTAKAVAEQLWKDGRSVVRVGTALKARDQTVVFSTKADAEQAKAVADSISGGAPVQTLSWKSDCQVVVAVGESAQ